MSRKKIMQKRMKDMNISYTDIARYVRLSSICVKKWVDGEISIPYTYVEDICDLLSIDFDDCIL